MGIFSASGQDFQPNHEGQYELVNRDGAEDDPGTIVGFLEADGETFEEGVEGQCCHGQQSGQRKGGWNMGMRMPAAFSDQGHRGLSDGGRGVLAGSGVDAFYLGRQGTRDASGEFPQGLVLAGDVRVVAEEVVDDLFEDVHREEAAADDEFGNREGLAVFVVVFFRGIGSDDGTVDWFRLLFECFSGFREEVEEGRSQQYAPSEEYEEGGYDLPFPSFTRWFADVAVAVATEQRLVDVHGKYAENQCSY